MMLFLKENFEKNTVKNYLQTTKNQEKLSSMQIVNGNQNFIVPYWMEESLFKNG